jgi:hypothetical protein
VFFLYTLFYTLLFLNAHAEKGKKKDCRDFLDSLKTNLFTIFLPLKETIL